MVVLPSGFQDRRIQPLCHSSPLIINSLRKCAESAVAHLVELRMQRGHFCRAHGAWHLRYRVNAKQLSVKLADCTDEYRTLTSVRPLAEPYLQTANSGQQANGHLALQEYAETVYFPHAKKSLKPSTYKGYFNLNPNTLSHALPDLDC